MRLSWLRRQFGGAPVSALALTLLVLGCVFVAVAGPRYSLHSRTRALQQGLAALAPVEQVVQLTDDWNSFTTQVSGSIPPMLADSQLSESRSQLAQFLRATPLPLGAGQWAGLSTRPLTVTAGAPPSAEPNGVAPRLEVIYRDLLTSNATLVAGSFPPPGSLGGTLHIAVTTATAARFGLHPGSVLRLEVDSAIVPVIVTAIVRPRMPASAFWNVDAAAAAPSYNVPGATANSPPVASFAGMVRDTVTRGEIAASWQLTGGDAVVDAGGTPAIVTPAVQQAVAALPGVHRTAVAWLMPWQVPGGQILTVVAVDPASYAAYAASVPYPPAPLARLGSSAGVITVLASPSAAALIGPGVGELTSQSGMGPLRVRVAGTVATTPAATGTGLFVIMPLQRIVGESGPPATNLLLITGTGFSQSALAAVVSKDVPAAAIRFRSAVLDGLVSSPLQAAADLIMRLSLAVAAGFGLAILLLGLALGSADRDLTLARLTTMGLEQGRLIRLVLGETLLAVVAAVAAGAACALALPALTSPALNLSVFTGSSAPVPIAPDLAALAVPAAGLAVLTAVAVVAETRLLRHRDVPGLLRIGG